MVLKLYFKKFFRIILLLIFRFQWWHTSPLDNRKYALDVINELNQKHDRDSVIELGCGLGDILGKAHYRKKFFYDISQNALNAAEFLQRFSLVKSTNTYKKFDFLTESLNLNLKFDAVVLVNWIHGYDCQLIKSRLNKIINNNLNKKGLVIFDVIDNNLNYKINHSPGDLIDINNFNVKIRKGYPFGRNLVIAQLK